MTGSQQVGAPENQKPLCPVTGKSGFFASMRQFDIISAVFSASPSAVTSPYPAIAVFSLPPKGEIHLSGIPPGAGEHSDDRTDRRAVAVGIECRLNRGADALSEVTAAGHKCHCDDHRVRVGIAPAGL